MKLTRKGLLTAVAMAGVSVLLACGSASNNDQGNSFQAYGWAVPDEQGVCTFGFVTTATVSLSGGISSEGYLSSSGASLCFVVGSRLTKQSIRADRMYYEFFIPGASEQPPTTSAPFTVVLTPPKVGDGSSGGSSSEGPDAQSVTIGARILPAQIQEWINLNRTLLPNPPFQLEGVYYVSGVTGSGSRLDTNKVNFNFVVTEDAIIPPVAGPTDDGAVTPTPGTSGTDGATTGDSTTSEGGEQGGSL